MSKPDQPSDAPPNGVSGLQRPAELMHGSGIRGLAAAIGHRVRRNNTVREGLRHPAEDVGIVVPTNAAPIGIQGS